ncbi:aspartate carbamoyltransferase catalytic subunit [Thalassovita aquimarina]|uniref:aspartate carbamoyltransferase catalytic subunit n=1 Tax=Thalassovita aquimarina TaxID=2785917 RepID=UPI0031B9F151
MVFKPANVMTFLFGLAFAGFALFWMIMASMAGGFFWMFGLIHFSVGIGISIGGLFWSAYRRRHSWYTLTNRRAFIATDLPLKGRSLHSYPITADTVLDLEEGALSTLHFAATLRRTKNGQRRVRLGFERIADGRAVYRMMRDIQRTERQEEKA